MPPAIALFGSKPKPAAEALTESDLAFLLDWSDPYRLMRGALKQEFERQMAAFIEETRMTGVALDKVQREDRLLVAASACTLSAGWPGYRWKDVTEVLLYPEDFDRDFQIVGDGASDGELSGEAHPWGTVLLSLPSLDDSFDDPSDGYHVGYHEFAHILDRDSVDDSGFGDSMGGLPSNIDGKFAKEMSRALEAARSALERGASPLDRYGLESPAEFWAVAVEGFFELRGALADAHPDLANLLDLYFNQREKN